MLDLPTNDKRTRRKPKKRRKTGKTSKTLKTYTMNTQLKHADINDEHLLVVHPYLLSTIELLKRALITLLEFHCPIKSAVKDPLKILAWSKLLDSLKALN